MRPYAQCLAGGRSCLGVYLWLIAIKNLGVGQFYLLTTQDSAGKPLDGGKTYRLKVPPNVPVEQYWSATAYDRCYAHADPQGVTGEPPFANSGDEEKRDGSIDVYFGTTAPPGQDSNWVPTAPMQEF